MNMPDILPSTPGSGAARRLRGDGSARVGTFAAALTIVSLLASAASRADVSVDWLYDFRHVTDPQDNPNNFPVVELKIFFPQSFGSFQLKQEIDLDGAHHNASEMFTELSQSIKLGNLALGGLPLLMRVGYAGGLGLSGGAAGGFDVQNAYELGLAYTFQLHQAFCDVSMSLRDTNFAKPSYDPMLTVYAGRYFLDYKLLLANSLEAWTTSTAQALSGQAGTSGQPRGSKFASWELESEAWYRVARHIYVGTYTRTTRNVYAISNRWVVYPSVGVRYTFDPMRP
jgi:hypothetical protein